MSLSTDQQDDSPAASPSAQKKPQDWMQEHGWFWIGGAGLMTITFVVLGLIINHSGTPAQDWLGSFPDYAHEIASAILGSILTLAFTALLLRAQERSTAELQRQQVAAQTASARELQQAQVRAERERENNTKFFEEKIKIYGELLKGLEDFLKDDKLADENFTRLTLTCLHVSYIANPNVLRRLNSFTQALLIIIREDSEQIDHYEQRAEGRDPITHAERKTILGEFGAVAAAIKTDLDKNQMFINDKEEHTFASYKQYYQESVGKEESRRHVTESIIDNLSQCSIAYAEAERRLKKRQENSPSAHGVSVSDKRRDEFLNNCSGPEECKFYEVLLQELDRVGRRNGTQYEVLWTKRGFSLEHTLKFFPHSGSEEDNQNVINRPASKKRRERIEQLLMSVLTAPKRFEDRQNIKFTWKEMKKTEEGANAWIAVIEEVLTPAHAEWGDESPVVG